jgi:hypothetical protein
MTTKTNAKAGGWRWDRCRLERPARTPCGRDSPRRSRPLQFARVGAVSQRRVAGAVGQPEA